MTNIKHEQQTSNPSLKEYSYPLALQGNGTAAKTLRLVGNNKKVLELGCSVGTQSKILYEELKCDVTGIELNSHAARQAEPYCTNVIVGNLDTLDFETEFPSQKFDVILCADVLEHIYNPTALLKRVKPLVSPNGAIVASIPNITHIALIFEMLHGKFDYRDKGLLDDTHIRFFTRSSLIRSFTDAGFIISHIDRGLAGVNETEFSVNNSTQEDNDILDYIRTYNEECFTYHFIVKAYPSDAHEDEIMRLNSEFELSDVQKMVHDKERKITQLEKKIIQVEKEASRLSSQLYWLESKLPVKLFYRLKSIFIRRNV